MVSTFDRSARVVASPLPEPEMMFLLAQPTRVATNPSARSKERPARGRTMSFMHASIETRAMSRDRLYNWREYPVLALRDAKAPHR